MAITFNLPRDLHEQAKLAAAAEHRSLSQFLTIAVGEAIERRAHAQAVADSATRLAALDREILDHLGA